MVATGQQAQCPNCGGPIVFRAGSSGAMVCPFCAFVVVRTGGDLALRGKVAELSATQAIIGVGAQGRAGTTSFTVLGRTQLDHGAGPWDEWYLAAQDGTWAWLAQAQGRWLLTREAPLPPGFAPSWDAVAPGSQITIGSVTWTVQERGVARIVSGQGELPFPIEPGGKGIYADLVAPGGQFATLDIGDGREPVRFFAGAELPEGTISFDSTGHREDPKVQTGNLKCPTCGGPVPLLTGDKAESATCPSCSSLLDVDRGNFRFVQQLQPNRVRPYIPLGTRGTFRGEAWTVIAFMQRFCVVEGISYFWREYLLFDEQRGFRWLLEDNGHWTFIRMISAGDVRDQYGSVEWKDASTGKTRRFRRFSSNVAIVDHIAGELYWKARLNERVVATDSIDPPFVISKEESDNEVVWSVGEYVEGKELWAAFKLPGSPPATSGVGTCQPKKPSATLPILVALAVTLGMCLVTCGAGSARNTQTYVDGPIQMGTPAIPPTPGVEPTGNPGDAYFTQPFYVAEQTSLSVSMSTANLQNGWAGVALALVNDTTGDVYELDLETEYWSGYEGGEYWTEGSTSSSERVSDVTPGWYVMRIDPEWSQTTGQPQATLSVKTASPAFMCGLCFLPLAWLPAIFAFLIARSHESKRWYNSNP